jgi:hypothetical protein
MSQNLLKLQIVNGRARTSVVDEDNDGFRFKEITIGSVTLTEEVVSGLSYDLVQTVSGDLQTQIDNLALDQQGVSGNLQLQIDQLSGAIDSILSNNPDQYIETVAEVSGQTIFDIPFTFDPLSTVLDVEVFINGRRYPQCTVGDFSTGNFRKNSSTQIELDATIPYNAQFVIWKQGTATGGGGGGSTDLDNIDTNPKPAVAGGYSLGTISRPWSGLYLKDTVTSQVWLLQVVSGAFEVIEVP